LRYIGVAPSSLLLKSNPGKRPCIGVLNGKEGQEPDYRFSLANERTFLAWIRTALALLAGGVLLEQFAATLQPRAINEIAMRHSAPVPVSVGAPLLSLVALILALIVGSRILSSR
jgi:putative membrane protein